MTDFSEFLLTGTNDNHYQWSRDQHNAFIQALEESLGSITGIAIYTMATLPTPTAGLLAYVSDAARPGGTGVMAFADGTGWFTLIDGDELVDAEDVPPDLELVTLSSPLDQTIVVNGAAQTVTASAPGATGALLYADDVVDGIMTDTGNYVFTRSYAPPSNDMDKILRVDATDGVDTVQTTALIASTIADGGQMWGTGAFSFTNINPTAGQADPDGGTNGLRLIGGTGTLRRYAQFTANPAATNANTSFRFRVELVGTMLPVLRVYNITPGSATYAEIDLTTGQTLNNRMAITAVRQTGNVWDIWVRWLDGSIGGTVWMELRGGFLAADNFNVPSGNHGIILYKLRVVDGPLGFYDHQKCSFRYQGLTVDGLERWIMRNAFEDDIDDMIQDYYVDVLVPDGWDRTTALPGMVVHPTEAYPGPGSLLTHDLVAMKAGNLHNTHQVIAAICQTKRTPWGGVKATGATDYQKLFGDILPGFLRREYGVLDGRENMLGLGYSKGGFGITAVALNYWATYGYLGTWDAPWTKPYADMVAAGYEVDQNYGSEAQFDLYTPSANFPTKKAAWVSKTRFVLSGATVFPSEMADMHSIMQGAGIPHSYLSSVPSAHDATVDWMVPVVNEMFRLRAL